MKFLNKQFTQETLKLALPVMLTQVGQVSVNLFDNIIVGKLLGAKALAAVSLGNAMFFSIFIFGLVFHWRFHHWFPKHILNMITTELTAFSDTDLW